MKHLIQTLIFLIESALFVSFISPSITYAATPSIKITKVPACRATGNLSGTASGVNFANYRVAVYINVDGGWWTKPTFITPTTPIASNGTWSAYVTSGGNDVMASKYAAFLIPKSYKPIPLSGQHDLPQELYDRSVANSLRNRNCPLREIKFSGYTWQVKYSAGPAGPGPNYFSDTASDVFVDSAGRLHLKIVNRNGIWYSTEVINKSILGYGKYTFRLASSVAKLDPSVVLGMFTWDPNFTDPYHREIDIEFSKWGLTNPSATNAQYVVQPYTVANNIHKFDFCKNMPIPQGSTHSFTWTLDKIIFRSSSLCGTTQADVEAAADVEEASALTNWVYTGDSIPARGKAQARINLWLFNRAAPTNGKPVEIIISSFKFTPIP